ncbi:MAG: ABC transporter permease [Lachnospiraceae bacterium]|nr:ABC transporter permease [Lachnospiraceae bacterium]
MTKQRITYLLLEMKRGIKLIPFFLRSFLLTAAALLAAAALLGMSLNRTATFDKINVGIVLADDDAQTAMALRLVSGMESVQSVCSFVYMDRQQAEQGIREGSLGAALLIPKDYYNDINNGKNTPLQILVPEKSTMGGELFQELLRSAASFIGITESAVYAFDITSAVHPYKKPMKEVEVELTEICKNRILNRETGLREQTFSAFGQVSLPQFYLCIAFFLLLILFGLALLSLYHAERMSSLRSLSRMGLGGGTVSLARIFVMSLDLWIFLLVLCPLGKYGLSVFLGVEGRTIFSVREFFGLYPYALSVAAFMHCIFALVQKSENGGLIYLSLMVAMIFLGGGILPVAYLPSWVKGIASILPLHVWQEYLMNLLWAGDGGSLMQVLGLALLFGLIGTFFQIFYLREDSFMEGEFKGLGIGKEEKDISTEAEPFREEEKGDLIPPEGKESGDLGARRALRFIGVMLKAALGRPSVWLSIAVALFFIYIAGGIVVPNAERSKIGFYSDKGEFSTALAALLSEDKETLRFEEAESLDALRRSVENGHYDCGFVLPHDSDSETLCLTSTSTVKSLIARERVFLSIFELQTEEMIREKSADGSVFLETGEDLTETVMGQFREFQKSGHIFRAEFITLGKGAGARAGKAGAGAGGVPDTEADEDRSQGDAASAAVLLGVCLFIIILLSGSYHYSEEYEAVSQALTQRGRLAFLLGHIVVFSFLSCGILLIVARLIFGIEGQNGIPGLLVFLLLSVLWTLLLCFLSHNEASFLCAVLAVLMFSLIAGPFLLDLLPGLPVIRIMSRFFPTVYF